MTDEPPTRLHADEAPGDARGETPLAAASALSTSSSSLHPHLPFPRAIGPSAPSLTDLVLGIRRGHGPDAQVIRIAARAGARGRLNWYIPVFALAVSLVLVLHTAIIVGGAAEMPARVFLVDSVVFLFAALSGWNMARTWRENNNQAEEISLTPLSPAVVGSVFVGATAIPWATVLLVIAACDLLVRAFLVLRPLGAHVASWGLPAAVFTQVVPPLGVHLLAVPALLWFHLETVRLAHWVFSVHALPRVSLRSAALFNLMAISAIVWTLGAVGGAITALVLLVETIIGTPLGFSPHRSPVAWELAAVPGILTVAYLKRLVSRVYESAFLRAWLLYQWAGAGERRQPPRYPRHHLDILPFWQAFYEMGEEENAGLPPHKRRATRRFEAICERIRQRRAEG